MSEQERIYPCDECGKLRTKDEGGTTFTICDECWEKHHSKKKLDIPKLREKIKALILTHTITLPKDTSLITLEGFDKAVDIRAGEIADSTLALIEPLIEEAKIIAYGKGVEDCTDSHLELVIKAQKQLKKAIQDSYQTISGDIVIPKEDWQELQEEKTSS